MPLGPTCPRCGVSQESITHALLWSDEVKHIWLAAPFYLRVDIREESHFVVWMSNFLLVSDNESATLVFEILYNTWSCCHLLVFERKSIPIPQLLSRAISMHSQEETIVTKTTARPTIWKSPPDGNLMPRFSLGKELVWELSFETPKARLWLLLLVS